MCSIAGAKSQGVVDNMLELMKHRAPDGNRVVKSGDFYIGNGRLAIIDLKTKDLLPYEEKGYVLAYNGEIYNYVELRAELEALGHKFRTTSDTEVLMKAFIEWGEQCLDKFNGMFAFVISDGKKIFMARDIAGEKPLYYTTDPFRFASEAKALDFQCCELPPAHYAVYDGNRVTEYRYWKLKKQSVNLFTAEADLELLLEDAVQIRTRSDVPYALYYSGGVDSSLISTFHRFDRKITYTDSDYEEEFLEVFPKILWHLDYPINSFSAFGLWKLAQEASTNGIRVVISGEGADELFGGYVRYLPNELKRQACVRYPSYGDMFDYEKDVNQLGWKEFNGNMQELLRMGDRMASAWGVENRCPFLDRRVIEFAFSLPPEFKVDGFDMKVILNRILKHRMGDYKPIEKEGLYCSVNKWLGWPEQKYSKEYYRKYQHELYKNIRSGRVGSS